jgi:hypothetical protein
VANSQSVCNIENNTVFCTQTGSTGYGVLVSDGSGANPTSTMTIKDNWVYIDGQIGISVTDVNAQEVTIKNNMSRGSSATMAPITDLSLGNDLITVGGLAGRNLAGFMRFQLATGQTIKISDYVSEAGTIGGVTIEGFIRAGTTKFQWFKTTYYGNTAMPTVVFVNNGSPNATAWLAAGDFTTAANSPSAGRVTCNFTNNDPATVFVSMQVTNINRF